MKVLVVDDDKVVLLSCRRVLEAAGHLTREADGAQRALAILSAEPVDLVLADVMMPGLDGFALIERARRVAPSTPVVLMTGYLTPQIKQRGMAAGAAGFIAKPFTPDELLEGLARVMGPRQA